MHINIGLKYLKETTSVLQWTVEKMKNAPIDLFLFSHFFFLYYHNRFKYQRYNNVLCIT